MGRPVGPGREAFGPAAGPRLSVVRAVVEYDGTAFCGLQFQPAVRTVAGELERALSALLAEPIKISAAGRTDAGVHATGQVVSFRTARAFPFERLALALNHELPGDLRVRAAEAAPARFSARFSAVDRTYVYAVLNRPGPSALLARYAYHVWTPLHLDRFEAGARHLIGEHDFRSFCGSLPESGPTRRCVKAVTVERRGDLLRICVCADGFLHRMVRTIVGTLLECAAGRRDPEALPEVLNAGTRRAAGLTAPPQGLYLAGVRYDDGLDSFREPPLFA